MDKDRLEELWQIQKNFSDKIIYGSPEQGTKELSLHVISEINELLREIAWKVHRREHKVVIKENILEEIIDLQKFVWSIALQWGFTADDVYQEFKRKSEVVEQLWHQEVLLDNLAERKNVVGVDIDGVLADYAVGFRVFLNSKGIKYDESKYHKDLITNGTLCSKEYENLKHEFRKDGHKANLPIISGAKEFLDFLHEQDYGIVLLTARPYKKYKRIFADTLEWLHKNDCFYDAIIFDEEKNIRLYREFGNRVLFFIEDELEKANDISDYDIKVYLLDRSYNKGSQSSKVIRVNDFNDIIRLESVK